jgi:phosphatidylserine/phosphatidylglycerophosphate/cardiolipin synthase-like enzyme
MIPIIGKEFPKKVIPLIDVAKRSIDIIVFDWRWYSQDPGASVQLFNQAVVRAAKRGVRVRAVVNSDVILNTLLSVGILAKRVKIKNLLHVKLMIIDDEVVILGSHNYTQSAFNVNLELSVILADVGPQLEFINFFNQIYG